jgi:uncharacterized protein DUF3761
MWRRQLIAYLAAFAAALVSASGAVAHHGQAAPAECKAGYYMNVSGHCIHSPSSSPVGATAKCGDGTYSYSEHASGTCSHHGGVGRWIHHP